MDRQLTLGEEHRDRGMALAVTNTDRELVHQVDLAIVRLVQTRPLFTAETVRADLEDAYRAEMPWTPAAVSKIIGARLNAAARRGLITTTGQTVKAKRPEAHARRLLVWRRA